jgi:predicted RNA-binding protein (virulence factor B family)
LAVIREAPPGLYLDGGELGEILLPAKYIPRDLRQKQLIDVFIYLDSEDRLVATTETPLAEVGEFAVLNVVSVNPRIGAFVHWGLIKDLLVPFRELDKPPRVGQKIAVYIYLDPASRRIVGSARINRYLGQRPPTYRVGQPVNLLIASESPLGYNTIVENAHRGLLFRDRTPTPLQIGQRVQGYVRAIRPDGRIDLSLDQGGYKRVAPLTTQIIEALKKNGGKLDFDDSTSPEKIRSTFHASKKAFKQALGALYKKRRIRFVNPGIELLDNSSYTPGAQASKAPGIVKKGFK